MRMMMFFWVSALCRLIGRCQYFGETLSIFTAEVTMLESGEICIGLVEGKAEGVGQSGTTSLTVPLQPYINP
jgi:hypothetical protein